VKQWLVVPLLLEEQLAGILAIGQDNVDADYTPWEIELVKVVATHTMLLLDCIRCWGQAQAEGRALAQQEMQRLIDDFLNLASHELNTSLTAIKGNVQVAQRRWAALKRQLAAQGESMGEKMERVEETLEATVKSVRLQERMLEDLIDDARIQSNELELSLQRHDLRALLREAVESSQRSVPQHLIMLESLPSANGVPVLADAGRIRRVITTYLEQALRCSPPDQPVTVRLTEEQTTVRLSVHDAGPAIPVEEQERIWDRFHASLRMAAEQEPDEGFGLGLYLSWAFVERHHGRVGVHSDAGQGTTFWFALPIAAAPAPSGDEEPQENNRQHPNSRNYNT
jgi:K+-sensing histidine kinase KdpD